MPALDVLKCSIDADARGLGLLQVRERGDSKVSSDRTLFRSSCRRLLCAGRSDRAGAERGGPLRVANLGVARRHD